MEQLNHFDTLLISGGVDQEQDLETIYHHHVDQIDESIDQMLHTVLNIIHQIKDSVVQIGATDFFPG